MSSKPGKLSIILVNFRSENLLRNCIQSILRFTANGNLEIIIVNNDEAFKGLDSFLADTCDVNVIEPDGNIGFGAANNLAFKYANGEYLLFVNPDIIFVEDIIHDILSFMNKNRNTGACAPMLMYEDGKYQNSAGFRYGYIYELFEIFMFNKIYRTLKKYYYLYLRKSAAPAITGWVSAACIFIKGSVFKELNGFDENIFLNYEDLDLCRRAEDLGYSNYYYPSKKCIHLDHRSFNDDYEKLIYQAYKSRFILSRKYYSYAGRVIIRFLNLSGILVRLIITYLSFKSKGKNSKLAGYRRSFDLYAGIHV